MVCKGDEFWEIKLKLNIENSRFNSGSIIRQDNDRKVREEIIWRAGNDFGFELKAHELNDTSAQIKFKSEDFEVRMMNEEKKTLY